MAKSNVVIYKDKEVRVTLQTWRGPGNRLFEFESNGVVLRVSVEKDGFAVVCEQGKIEVASPVTNPFGFTLKK